MRRVFNNILFTLAAWLIMAAVGLVYLIAPGLFDDEENEFY